MSEDRVVEDLLLRATAGEEHALSTLIESTLPGLRAYVTRRLDRATAAKESVSDLVQSACREVIRTFDTCQYEGELPFRAYLYRTALNKVIDRRRYYLAEKRGAAREIPLQELTEGVAAPEREGRESEPEFALLRAEEIDKLEHAWAQLPEELREVLSLRRIYGLSNRSTAERLGISPARTRQLLGRALARLTSLYELDEDRVSG